MAELTGFAYRAGNTFFHVLDSRVKLIALVLFSVLSMRGDPVVLAVLSVVLIYSTIHLRIAALSLFREIRLFLLFLVLIFISRSLVTSGIPVFPEGLLRTIIPITREGVFQGAFFCWRLLVVVFIGLVFTATTKTRDIRFAVAWFLKPVPFVAEHRVATMISLLIRFLPEIIREAKQSRDAQRARCIELRKNIIYKTVWMVFPLLRRTFERADKLAIAMESRGYSGNRALPRVPIKLSDTLFLAAVFSVATVLMILY